MNPTELEQGWYVSYSARCLRWVCCSASSLQDPGQPLSQTLLVIMREENMADLVLALQVLLRSYTCFFHLHFIGHSKSYAKPDVSGVGEVNSSHKKG